MLHLGGANRMRVLSDEARCHDSASSLRRTCCRGVQANAAGRAFPKTAGASAELEVDRLGRAEHDWEDVRWEDSKPRSGISWGRLRAPWYNAWWSGLAHDWG